MVIIRKWLEILFNILIVFCPFVLFVLPINYFDSGESICLSKVLANIECYGCGMTRGIMHLIHFDFSGAWMYNKLSFIVMPMLFPYWVKSVYFVFNKPLPNLLKFF